jgi:hypothetical protein
MSERTPQFSYSNTDAYNTCALQWQEVVWLKKHPSGTNEAAERGTMMHQWLEDCIKDGSAYPEDKYQWILDDVRSEVGLVMPEMKLAINDEWEPTTFFADDVFYRAIIDVTILNGHTAKVRDLKTGKRRFKKPDVKDRWLIKQHDTGVRYAPDMLTNARQANDYALMIFLHYHYIKEIEFSFVWSDADEQYDHYYFDRETHEKQMLATLLNTPRKIIESLETDNFPPNPSGLCYAHCPVKDCDYNGKRWAEIKKVLA